MSYQRHTERPLPGLESFSWDLSADEKKVRDLSSACSAADGCRNLDEVLLWAAAEGRAWAWWDPTGQSYLAVCPQGRLELLVHPTLRGQGVGTALLREGVARLRELKVPRVSVWAYGDRAPSVVWLERHGFVTEQVLYRLDRVGEKVEFFEWGPDWSVRLFRSEDAEAWHSLHTSLQLDSSQAWSLETLRRQLQDPRTPAAEFFLLWQGSRLRGYLWLKGSELFMFALDPSCRGRGLGSKLLAFGLNRLEGDAFVYCDDKRPAALALYRKFGFQESARDRCLTQQFSGS